MQNVWLYSYTKRSYFHPESAWKNSRISHETEKKRGGGVQDLVIQNPFKQKYLTIFFNSTYGTLLSFLN